MSKAAEVAFGESREEAILRRWLKLRKKSNAVKYVKSPPMCDFDWYVVDKHGFILAYVEVKLRRTALAKYGDAMFPLRKHERAVQSLQKHRIKFLGVTEYGCGSLVEVDLAKPPAQKKDVARRDRPGMTPVPHAFYAKAQLTILERGETK